MPSTGRTSTEVVSAQGARFAIATAIVAALTLVGCSQNGLQYERIYPMREAQFYKQSVPDAMLSVVTPPSRGEPGRFVGYVHGWPFAHQEPSGALPATLFSFAGKFTVTHSNSPGDVQAVGTRTIYFHPEGAPTRFDDPRAFESGTPVITERISLAFAFDAKYQRATVQMSARQLSAHSFVYQGRTINPPARARRTASFVGNYAGVYGGFLLHEAKANEAPVSGGGADSPAAP